MATTHPPVPDDADALALLRACVKARMDYWKCVNALATKIGPNGVVSDRANDLLVRWVDDLADFVSIDGHTITDYDLAKAVTLASL